MDKNESAFPFGQISELTGQPINGCFSSGMTAQAYAAIHLKVTSPDMPDWLNKMIDRSRRDDFARAAITACADYQGGTTKTRLISDAHEIANAMMEESK